MPIPACNSYTCSQATQPRPSLGPVKRLLGTSAVTRISCTRCWAACTYTSTGGSASSATCFLITCSTAGRVTNLLHTSPALSKQTALCSRDRRPAETDGQQRCASCAMASSWQQDYVSEAHLGSPVPLGLLADVPEIPPRHAVCQACQRLQVLSRQVLCVLPQYLLPAGQPNG